MHFPLIPDFLFESIYTIDIQRLRARGVKLLLADLDNTLVPYSIKVPTDEVKAWRDKLKEAGITLFILSNSRKPGRAQRFAEALGVPYQGHAGKPSTRGLEAAMARAGADRAHTAMLGDKLLTDMLGANRAGVLPLMVEPLGGPQGAWNHVLHALQRPWKAASRKKHPQR